jgi:hypothetical protein
MLARFGLCTLILASWSTLMHATDIPALVQKAKPAVVEILTYDQQNRLMKTGTLCSAFSFLFREEAKLKGRKSL